MPAEPISHLLARAVRVKGNDRLEDKVSVGVGIEFHFPKTGHLKLAGHMRARNCDQGTTVFVSGLKIGAIEFHRLTIGGALAVSREVGCHLDRGRWHRRRSGDAPSTRFGASDRGFRISLAQLEDDI